ncbi:ribokinase [Thalassobacillus devorans]|uniref:ribokinase n=1 Tax=Thalassobacillus devorans TaxID=279813 RepID=UPI001593FC83|nr:ribokinase [Thalassobacillus devorans]
MYYSEIVVVGSLNMDIVIKVDNRPKIGETIHAEKVFYSCGGKGANQAYAAAKLGGEALLIGIVGNDDFGKTLMANLEQAKVNTESIHTAADATSGVAIITLDKTGENNIILGTGANGAVNKSYIQQNKEYIQNAKLLVIQLEVPLEAVKEAIQIAFDNQIPVLLDPAPAQKLPSDLLEKIDFITPNETELTKLTDVEVIDLDSAIEASKQLINKGVKNVFAKLGKEGVVVVNSDLTYFHIEGHIVEVKDTTSAGDAFAGALAKKLVDQVSLKEAAIFANEVAAMTVTKYGAQKSIPSLEELNSIENKSYKIMEG